MYFVNTRVNAGTTLNKWELTNFIFVVCEVFFLIIII